MDKSGLKSLLEGDSCEKTNAIFSIGFGYCSMLRFLTRVLAYHNKLWTRVAINASKKIVARLVLRTTRELKMVDLFRSISLRGLFY